MMPLFTKDGNPQKRLRPTVTDDTNDDDDFVYPWLSRFMKRRSNLKFQQPV